jgi:hypothetical protein
MVCFCEGDVRSIIESGLYGYAHFPQQKTSAIVGQKGLLETYSEHYDDWHVQGRTNDKE